MKIEFRGKVSGLGLIRESRDKVVPGSELEYYVSLSDCRLTNSNNYGDEDSIMGEFSFVPNDNIRNYSLGNELSVSFTTVEGDYKNIDEFVSLLSKSGISEDLIKKGKIVVQTLAEDREDDYTVSFQNLVKPYDECSITFMTLPEFMNSVSRYFLVVNEIVR